MASYLCSISMDNNLLINLCIKFLFLKNIVFFSVTTLNKMVVSTILALKYH